VGFARGLAGAFFFAGALAGALGALADRFCLLSKLTFKKFILIYPIYQTVEYAIAALPVPRGSAVSSKYHSPAATQVNMALEPIPQAELEAAPVITIRLLASAGRVGC
jgi:hypothetical protein